MANQVKKKSPAASKNGAVKEGRRFDRYEILLATSADMFRKNGYDATSLQQIADEVGILKGSLYYYIDTKEDLLFAIIKRNHEHIIQGNVKWREVTDDPLGAIEAFIEGHIRSALEHATYSEVFVRDFRALSEHHAKEIRTAQEAYDGEFRSLIAAAMELGLLREDIEPAFASRVIFGMSNWIFYWVRPSGALSLDEVVEKLTKMAMASLR